MKNNFWNFEHFLQCDNLKKKKIVIFSIIRHNIVQGFHYFVDAAYGNNFS